MTAHKTLVCCLAGNPNTGKTTIFNNLTGARQKIGNYAGVTVERIEGSKKHGNTLMRFIDLPGAYSLNARSDDEKISRDVLMLERPDVIIQVIDATHLDRNLLLTLQLLELGIPLVIALNMTDEAAKNGITIIPRTLEAALGVPVVPTIGSKRWGMSELVETVKAEAGRTDFNPSAARSRLRFPDEAEKLIAPLADAIERDHRVECPWSAGWAAKLLLENDTFLLDELCPDCDCGRKNRLGDTVAAVKESIRKATGQESDVFIAAERTRLIGHIVRSCLRREKKTARTRSERIDDILVNRWLGFPVFLAVMYAVFWLSVDVASPLIDLVDGAFASLGEAASAALNPGLLQSLVVDGIIAGVGGVMVFVPQIMIMFFCIALLEASGYLSRAAFVIDRVMRAIGLNGKAFIPMLVGFGCNVPAILATRTIESRRDRLTTMMTMPFMSCGARLPVYLLITGAFFPGGAGADVIFGLYLLGILVAIATAKIFRTFVWKGEASPLVAEIPPYRLPVWRGVFGQMWLKAWAYIKKAGTVILAAAIIIWCLTAFPRLDAATAADYAMRAATVTNNADREIATLIVSARLPRAVLPSSVTNEAGLTNHAPFGAVLADVRAAAELATTNDMAAKATLERTRQTASEIFPLALAYNERAAARDKALVAIANEGKARQMRDSYAGRLGTLVAPVLAPLGLDDWKIAVALLAGFTAKEIVVGTMGSLYAIGGDEDETSVALQERLREDPFFRKQADGTGADPGSDWLKGLALMVFVLLYLPCQAVIGVFVKEAGAKLALVMVGYTTFVAWFVTLIVYQGGRLLGF